jgi:hypothetical protein
LKQDGYSFTAISNIPGLLYTGAMCVWKKDGVGDGNLLLLGTQNGGYQELRLDSGQPTSTLVPPGGQGLLSSISSVYRDTYNVTIAKHPVMHILQVPLTVSNANLSKDGQPLIYASTFKDGVWSLRDGTWNGEP